MQIIVLESSEHFTIGSITVDIPHKLPIDWIGSDVGIVDDHHTE